ncbi:hypothetical protein OVA10_03560 [Lelliottia sp. SL45]|uniref:helix-turn-helix domain-containing protein n=1 Tax=Lelliottia sp. SL45 TaxID=2994665 RepID=UPI0022726FD4|nr:hypothetical protein [Lelliottia sp. SL45]MCY1697166.1 hypothetical protein [Lelliottia sp. SL45]
MATVKQWTETEMAFLKQNYGHIPVSDIAAALGRTESAVGSKASNIGISTRSKATQPIEEVRKLKSEGMTITGIAEKLGLTANQVNHYLYNSRYGHAGYSPRGRITWTKDRIGQLIQMAKACTSVNEMAKQLGATPAAIRVKASTLGLVLPNGQKRYSQLDVDLAYQMKAAGFSVRNIAAKLDDPPISVHTVRRILSNESPSWEMLRARKATL